MKNKLENDIAFEKERDELKRKIRLQEREICKKDFRIYELNRNNQELQSTIDSLNEFIERLIEYAGTTKDDLEMMLSANKVISKFSDIKCFFGIDSEFRKEK